MSFPKSINAVDRIATPIPAPALHRARAGMGRRGEMAAGSEEGKGRLGASLRKVESAADSFGVPLGGEAVEREFAAVPRLRGVLKTAAKSPVNAATAARPRPLTPQAIRWSPRPATYIARWKEVAPSFNRHDPAPSAARNHGPLLLR